MLKNSYIDALIEKRDSFCELSDKEYVEILQRVLPQSGLVDVLKKESLDYDNFLGNSTKLEENIWNLVYNLNVNIETIKLLSSISEYVCSARNIKSWFRKDSVEIDKQLDRWSLYDYKKLINDWDSYNTSDVYHKRTAIQMLIWSYKGDFDVSKSQNLDGAVAYNYRYGYKPMDYWDINEYKKFIETHGERIDGKYKDEQFSYFHFNEENYQEKFFKVFYKHCYTDAKLVLKNFHKIGKSIIVLDKWDMQRIFKENSLSEEKKEYYTNLYIEQQQKQQNMNEILDIVNGLPQKQDYNLLLEKIILAEDKASKKVSLLYIVIISILLYQVFFR